MNTEKSMIDGSMFIQENSICFPPASCEANSSVHTVPQAQVKKAQRLLHRLYILAYGIQGSAKEEFHCSVELVDPSS